MKKTLLLLVALITATIAFAYNVKIDGINYNLNDETKTAEVARGCSDNITIPEKVTYNSTEYSVTSIGDDAFFYCSSLTSISIPNSVTSIGESAFNGCESLTSITIPNSVTSIGDVAFNYCSSLTSITIPNSVTSIGESAFRYCSSLTSITIGNSVTSIGDDAFEYCKSLTSITIPNSVTSIGEGAFSDCSSLTSIEVDANNQNYASIDDVLYNKDVTTLICCPEGKTSITIPNSVTSIGEKAFSGCSSLTSITIPNSVTSIGNNAFDGCSSLTSITIPNSITSIGKFAFDYCSSLTSISIPNSVTSIGYGVFRYCSSLTSISIPNSVTSIGTSAFSYCSSLTSITIPNSITSIGDDAFKYCSSLTSIEVDANNQNYASIDGVLYNKKITTLICCPGGKTSITIPNSVTSIGDDAFEYCSSLTSITIPNSVTSIGEYAFRTCSSLTSITIPNSVTSIGEKAFSGCSSLTSITIPNSVTSIGGSAFSECSSLTSITIGNSVTAIGDYAFSWCSSLTSITCLGSTPPSANNLQAQYETCILFVPKGSLNDYQNHAEWGKFLNIQELKGEKYAITTAVNDESMGSVIGEGEYEKDSEITLTATPNDGYRFTQWSDGNTDNPRTIIVTQDSTFTAIFELEEYALYATSASPELGYVKHTIEAIAIEGFEFDRWSDGNTENPRTIVLTEDTKLYAYFRIAQGENPTDLETSKISSANIYTTNGILHIEGATENYHILDAAGRLIYSGNATTLQLPRGIYLVTIGGEVEKIAL